MKIYLCRHGQTTGDIEDRYGGDYDDHLTEKGIEQSKGLAKKLVGKEIEIIYHSPKARAVETAKIIAEELKVPLLEMHNLRERNHYGALTGLTKTEAAEKYPGQVKELNEKPVHHKLFSTEHYKTFKERILHVFDIITSEQNKVILVVTHGGPIRCVIRELLGKELVKMDDCAIIELEKDGEKYKLLNLDGAE